MKATALSALCAASLAHAAFKHPGYTVDQGQLDFVKAKLAAKQEPWASAFAKMNASEYASLTRPATPRADVDCGSGSNPNNGCTDERGDAVAAYTQALLWYYTGNADNAKKAIEILNAWSAVLTQHTNSNASLQAGWSASTSIRAAEIMRATYPAWPAAESKRFGDMLVNAYLPNLTADKENDNGNWELTMIDATLGVAVYTDNRALFDSTLARWRARAKAYVYMTSDGSLPVPPPGGAKSTQSALISYWQGQSTFVDGLAQETCRDFGHTQFGFASLIAAAETAYLQGVDLYGEEAKRITAGLEFHADYLLGKAAPSWLCGGTLSLSVLPTWEIGYNHYANRMKMPLPLTQKLIETKVRPSGAEYHIAWETLTHAETGLAGVSAGVRDEPDVRPGLGLTAAAPGATWEIFDLNGTRIAQVTLPEGAATWARGEGAISYRLLGSNRPELKARRPGIYLARAPGITPVKFLLGSD